MKIRVHVNDIVTSKPAIFYLKTFPPQVSAFGLGRTALDGHKHISTHVMGTLGYLGPEYAMTGHLLVKSDLYSSGVALLELLTRRKPVDLLQPPGQENLVTWARYCSQTRRLWNQQYHQVVPFRDKQL